jgi:hypothetical protein
VTRLLLLSLLLYKIPTNQGDLIFNKRWSAGSSVLLIGISLWARWSRCRLGPRSARLLCLDRINSRPLLFDLLLPPLLFALSSCLNESGCPLTRQVMASHNRPTKPHTQKSSPCFIRGLFVVSRPWLLKDKGRH